MTTVIRLQQAIIALKAKLATRPETVGASRSGATAKQNRTARRTHAAPSREVEIGARLGALNLDSPDIARQSRRAFVESILTGEFGEGIAMDPRFGALIEKVAEILEQDDESRGQIDALLVDLIAHPTLPG